MPQLRLSVRIVAFDQVVILLWVSIGVQVIAVEEPRELVFVLPVVRNPNARKYLVTLSINLQGATFGANLRFFATALMARPRPWPIRVYGAISDDVAAAIPLRRTNTALVSPAQTGRVARRDRVVPAVRVPVHLHGIRVDDDRVRREEATVGLVVLPSPQMRKPRRRVVDPDAQIAPLVRPSPGFAPRTSPYGLKARRVIGCPGDSSTEVDAVPSWSLTRTLSL